MPIAFTHANGAAMWDVDGNQYIDYSLAYGPLILGHNPRRVVDAIEAQVRRGISFGANHPLEAQLAEAICRVVPSAEQCIFSNTGTEAVQVALRIARAATGRTKIVKFLGHYHGWADNVNLGSYGETDRTPGSAGQDPGAMAATIVVGWNDIDALREVLDDDTAAVIMEPVNVDGGCLHASDGYLEEAAGLVRANGTVLIFDEVITGFRISLGGAQAKYACTPDLTVLGKALGGGLPISAVVGRTDLMAVVADGRVTHAGTHNGNPVTTAAALAVISELEAATTEIYAHLDVMSTLLAEALQAATSGSDHALNVRRDTGVGHGFQSPSPILEYGDTLCASSERYGAFTAAMLAEGVHLMPKGILYVSVAHTEGDITRTYEAARRAIRRLHDGRQHSSSPAAGS
ncbi:aspartate aminotransferase family protein [Promicromonospora sp. NFX87]|uniref:aspartate aminotransferase family protein n=1 Tax=Promicromonospora sp. NFX87 TaxID=3402691 RepID=UPI003AFA6098